MADSNRRNVNNNIGNSNINSNNTNGKITRDGSSTERSVPIPTRIA